MRRILSHTSFILLAVAGIAGAQTPATAPDVLTPSRAGRGFVDFGARGTTSEGDAARYERYRDMSDGMFLETATWVRDWKSSLFDFRAEHVGRKDQRYNGAFIQPGNRHPLANVDRQIVQPERTQPVVLLADVADLQDGAHTDRRLPTADPLFTSSRSRRRRFSVRR